MQHKTLPGRREMLKQIGAIKKVGDAGSVIGITGVRMFVKDDEPTTVAQIWS